jgi:hypothetical protein
MKYELDTRVKNLVGKKLFYLRNNGIRFQVSKVNGYACPVAFPETGRLRIEIETPSGSQTQKKAFMGLEYHDADTSYTNDAIVTKVTLEIDPSLCLFVGKTVAQLRSFLYDYQPMVIESYGSQKRSLMPEFVLGRVVISVANPDPAKQEVDQIISGISVQGINGNLIPR